MIISEMRWLVALLLLILAPRPAAAQGAPEAGQQLSYAEQTFLEGQRLFFEKQYDDALPLFEQSFYLQPSPNSRLYIARCLVELGELVHAYDVYREVIVDVSETETPARYTATQQAASEERAAVRKRLAIVRISLLKPVPGLRLFLDNREVQQREASAEHFANPGTVRLRTRALGFSDFEHDFVALGGAVTEVLVVLPEQQAAVAPAPAPRPIVRTQLTHHPAEDWAWASAGVGVAGLATWGVFAVQAERRFYRIQPQCEQGACPLDQVERGRRETLISNIGLVTGVAGFAGAGGLWLWSRSEETDAATPRERAQRPGAVGLAVLPGSIELHGQF